MAGDRLEHDPVAGFAKVSCKAEVSIAGKTMLERVISALANSISVGQIITVGPDKDVLKRNASLRALMSENNVYTMSAATGPSLSAQQGVLQSSSYPTLITTCDVPLLTPQLVDQYCQQVSALNADFVIGAVEHKYIRNLLPLLKKTTYQFGKQPLCFANLFAVLTESGIKAINFWRTIETSRKKPLEVIRQVGWTSIMRYKLGALDTMQAARQLSCKTDANIIIEKFAYPELAIDVDSVDDYKILQEFLNQE